MNTIVFATTVVMSVAISTCVDGSVVTSARPIVAEKKIIPITSSIGAFESAASVTLANIDLELNDISLNNALEQKVDSFMASADLFRNMLKGSQLRFAPDVFSHADGYIGLYWNTKNDADIYLVSIPSEGLFYKEIDGETTFRTKVASMTEVTKLISKINDRLA